MKKTFMMPNVNVECFDVTDVVTLSGINFGEFVSGDAAVQGSFDYFAEHVGINDTRLG